MRNNECTHQMSNVYTLHTTHLALLFYLEFVVKRILIAYIELLSVMAKQLHASMQTIQKESKLEIMVTGFSRFLWCMVVYFSNNRKRKAERVDSIFLLGRYRIRYLLRNNCFHYTCCTYIYGHGYDIRFSSFFSFSKSRSVFYLPEG